MASLSRHLHPKSTPAWARLAELVPDFNVEFAGDLEEPMGLRFTDPDGEAHVYVMSEQGRKGLVEMLTGGVLLPDRNGDSRAV